MKKEEIKNEILNLVKEYHQAENNEKSKWEKGQKISYAARVYDEKELINLVDSALEFWLTAGRYAKQFEEEFASYLSVKHAYAVNSGSSANLLAFMSLTSHLLCDKRILPNDEVITVAAGFPTTIAPIIQYGAIPVFLDVDIPSYNIRTDDLESALSNKTKAVFIAHTLGVPFDIVKVKEFCDKHGLWLIEDNCDALGAEVHIDGKWKKTGTIGDIGTSSFYPPHHMTMGEGGAIYTNNDLLSKIIHSLRDWGRDCVCPSGVDNYCGKRFDGQFGELPKGYDHKYVYSHFGYNLKITDMQAAIGCAQLQKLPYFVEKRRQNWKMIRDGIQDCKKNLILPDETPDSHSSPFGFIVTIRDESITNRTEAVTFLENKGIQTRMLFSGNIIKHPCFDAIRNSGQYRIVSGLSNTDKIMNNSFWVGVYPGMTTEQLQVIINAFNELF